MRRVTLLVVSCAAILGLLTWSAHRAAADDETNDIAIRIQAPLDAVDCTANTISVLGLTIDISTAAINADGSDQGSSGSDQSSGDTGDSGSGDNGDGDNNGGSMQPGCAGLTAGQPVDVRLASDAAPLSAVRVDQTGDSDVRIQAPVQAADATGQTITVLGLTVSVANASMDGSDDQGDDSGDTVDLSQLMPGQFVELRLDPSQLPALVATEVQVRNFTNQMQVEVDDSTGTEVDDSEDSGAPSDDVDVEVDDTVVVQNPNPTATTSMRKHIKQIVHLHTASSGSFVLSGLPTGRAKLTVTRTHNGVTTHGKRTVVVHPNITRSVRVKLH